MSKLSFLVLLLVWTVCLVTVPKSAVEIFLYIELLAATGIFTCHFMDWKLPGFPKLILLFSLFSIAVNMRIAGINLESVINKDEGDYIVKLFRINLGLDWIGQLVISLVLLALDLLVVVKGAARVAEVTARFTLDAMNSRIFDIQNRLNKQEFSEEEAERQKILVSEEIDRVSYFDGTMKFMSGCVKCTILLLLVILIGGILAGMFVNKMSITDALSMNMSLFFSYVIAFTVPQIIVGLSTVYNYAEVFN